MEARRLEKVYRRGPEEVHALRGVSFALAPREIVALVGPSGSGKTTLLNVIVGWESLDRGEIVWSDGRQGIDLRWDELAVLPQSHGLVEELSVRENVDLPARLSGRLDPKAFARTGELLDELGLSALADRAPSECSIGEQQRTALARALVQSPRLVLADEPTGHQDVEWARKVFLVLRRAAKQGTACLVATHNPEAIEWADRVLTMRDGEVHAIDPESTEKDETP
jgi:putative ABC transport system ATP-binding protein